MGLSVLDENATSMQIGEVIWLCGCCDLSDWAMSLCIYVGIPDVLGFLAPIVCVSETRNLV